ncbi:hypothetical protein [Nocardia aurantia]|uniref:hypothetical protein n=1 Tax=Nocardia aurantia TaxID=2585199 RepID=UPI001296EF35|nr:hypothetical protein [Nocardia aurantia]
MTTTKPTISTIAAAARPIARHGVRRFGLRVAAVSVAGASALASVSSSHSDPPPVRGVAEDAAG